MTFSDQVRSAAARAWDAAVRHQLVDELWEGRVPALVLGAYLVQDHQIHDASLALLGAAVAAADQPASRTVLARRLGGVAGSESDFLTHALDALDVPLGERTHPQLPEPTHDLLEVLHAARRSADYPTCLTVLLAAEWLHLDMATRPGADAPEEPLHRTWIDLHRGPAVEAWVSFLRLEFDRTAAVLDQPAHAALQELFVRVVGLELAVLDTAGA